jgi:hypothetical protein
MDHPTGTLPHYCLNHSCTPLCILVLPTVFLMHVNFGFINPDIVKTISGFALEIRRSALRMFYCEVKERCNQKL